MECCSNQPPLRLGNGLPKSSSEKSGTTIPQSSRKSPSQAQQGISERMLVAATECLKGIIAISVPFHALCWLIRMYV